MKASLFFTKSEKNAILEAIKEAEKNTSGEIRVHIETRCKEDVLDRAAWIFRKLGMDKTRDRNGVLFYLAVKDRKFAIIGDAGINSKVPEGFWNQIKEIMEKNFKEGHFAEGLSEGIKLAGEKLKEYFPYNRDDINELSDDISFDNTEIKKEK
ncbi:MAG TPA: TPM domain-containing protein [Bacteroidales bacterium]|nr:TPM domain-containing protein [Bacteroidales bacterium]HOU97056.1 TPM domain-containing protein [Bacteroidales bacterium]HQG36202.1 TPM domain-containing protein [Bacteroidales bacterium]HQG53547.1 TPM domain-containing protein [Bacteroidales bacterium]HQJ21590.1 TPM domain-containing protein [Bacteroidales bacterium]